MEVPDRLATKEEDSMPSTFRATAAVVVLASLLGLSTFPADAQPRRAQATDQQAETKILGELWHWLADRWAAPGVLQQTYRALTQSTTDAGLNRGGVYDPNGHP
jgi:hypothetical protein